MSDSEQSAIVNLTADGKLSLKKVTDSALVGEHTLLFDVLLSDLDPDGIFKQTVDFQLVFEIVTEEDS